MEPAGAPQPDRLLQRETREKIQQVFRRLPAKLQVAARCHLECPTFCGGEPFLFFTDPVGMAQAERSRAFRNLPLTALEVK